ncbi:hypothetical protein MMC19_004100 [Ptychographa xylographoides]|nr:hypothetical protein [Ptychographa xylographoides]
MATTLILLSIPPGTLVGIDLLSFTSSPRFNGVSGLPPGWHFLFTSPTTSLSTRHGTWFDTTALISDTHGGASAPVNLVFKWSTEKEELVPVTNRADLAKLGDVLGRYDGRGRKLREGLFPYRQTATGTTTTTLSGRSPGLSSQHSDEDVGGGVNADIGDVVEESTDWSLLTAHFSHALLSHFANPPSVSSVGSPFASKPMAVSHSSQQPLYAPELVTYTLTTTSCAPQDLDEIPGLSTEDMRSGLFDGEERELGFLDIDLRRTWREGAVGRERTEGARDRSWALEDVVARNGSGSGNEEDWGARVLGATGLCFLMVLTLSNYSCLEEWKRILTVVLTCRRIIREREQFFISFLRLLRLQLSHCDDVEGGLFDIHAEGSGSEGNLLRKLLKSFKAALAEVYTETEGDRVKEAMEEVEEWVRREWKWELGDSWLRRGIVELEDGEQVEVEMAEMEGEDERGEYAPVIVEL